MLAGNLANIFRTVDVLQGKMCQVMDFYIRTLTCTLTVGLVNSGMCRASYNLLLYCPSCAVRIFFSILACMSFIIRIIGFTASCILCIIILDCEDVVACSRVLLCMDLRQLTHAADAILTWLKSNLLSVHLLSPSAPHVPCYAGHTLLSGCGTHICFLLKCGICLAYVFPLPPPAGLPAALSTCAPARRTQAPCWETIVAPYNAVVTV